MFPALSWSLSVIRESGASFSLGSELWLHEDYSSLFVPTDSTEASLQPQNMNKTILKTTLCLLHLFLLSRYACTFFTCPVIPDWSSPSGFHGHCPGSTAAAAGRSADSHTPGTQTQYLFPFTILRHRVGGCEKQLGCFINADSLFHCTISGFLANNS